MANHDPLHAELPENLRRRFDALDRRLWKIETAAAASFALLGLVVSYLTLFVSDRIWDSPVWFRTIGAGIGAAALCSAALWWLRRRVFQRRDLRALAVLVQGRFPRLGDRLLGIVELSTEEKHSPDFSPSLYRAAIQQVAAEAERFNFREAADPRRAEQFLAATVGLLAVLIAVALLVPPAALNALQRWASPFSSIERYTLVALNDVPKELIVPHGEPFSVEAEVDYRSFWKPAQGVARIERQAGIVAGVNGTKLNFHFPGQTERGSLKIRVGDAQKEVTVVPTHRPALKELAATVKLPDYLQYPPLEEAVRGGVLRFLEGSDVAFHGKASRDLHTAQMKFGVDKSSPLEIEGEQFTSGFVKADGPMECVFDWRDNLGLSNNPPARLILQPQKDAPPLPQLPELPREVAMLHSDVLQIRELAQDDFGVRSLGLSWELMSGVEQPQSSAISEVRADISSRQEKRAERTFSWSPSSFQIPPDSSVELVAFARDFFPERERVSSPVCRIYVLGDEKHAELLRQQLDSLLARLEEVTRLEEKVLANTTVLQDATNSPQTTEKIAGAKNDQSQNAAQLEQLAAEGSKTLREALKNPLFPEEALRQWAADLQAMQQLSQQQMKQAAAALQSAQQNAASRPQKLAEAAENEREALEKLAKMQAKVNEQLDDLKAMTLSQRLRQVGGSEKEIKTGLETAAPEVIGLLPKELPEKFRKLITTLAGVQGNAQSEAQTLQGEINRFFERTQKTNYGVVTKEMTETRVVDELDRVRGLILENIAMQAAKNSGEWSERFSDWADKLEPVKNSDSSGGEGEGSGSCKRDMTQTLIALLRMRESERNLREQTRLLDEQKAEATHYKSRAKSLSASQAKLADELAALQKGNEIDELEDAYDGTHDSMKAVMALLAKPQTDAVTDQAEVKTVESLSDLINLINEQAKRNPPQQAGQNGGGEEMNFLMQMMSPGKNSQPGFSPMGGGNTAGGTTSRVASPATGDARGRNPGERKISKAGGAGRNLPVEFRETLENYFKAVEQKE